MKKGKAAINNAETTQPVILWEELVDGPFFGDDRCGTKDEEMKANQSLNTRRPEQETGSGERPEIVGTTNCVRGGSRLAHFLKWIQPSYDRVGRETEEREKPDLEFDTGIGKLCITELPALRQWLPDLVIDKSDFVGTKNSMMIAISADLEAKTALSSKIAREYGPEDFVFRQRPGIGKILLLTPQMTQEAGKHLCLMLTRIWGKHRVALPTLFKCLENFRDKLIALSIQKVIMPVSGPSTDLFRHGYISASS